MQFSPIQLALLLLGAFWAGTSALFSGVDYVTKTRDKILLGKIDGHDLTPDQRRRILFCDWVPMRLSLAAISVVLCLIIGFLPSLAENGALPVSRAVSVICYLTAAVPLGGFLNFVGLGLVQFVELWKAIRCAENKEQMDTGDGLRTSL